MKSLYKAATLALAALMVTSVATPAAVFATAQSQYSTAKTSIGTLLADPAAKSILAKHFPALLQSKQVKSGMANRFTLRSLKRFKPKMFTEAALAAADADFAKMAKN